MSSHRSSTGTRSHKSGSTRTRTHTSHISSSRRSSSISIQDAILQAAIKKTELQCRAEAIERRQALEKEEYELQARSRDIEQRKELLEIKTEINVEDARIACLGKYEASARSGPLSINHNEEVNGNVAVRQWLDNNTEEDQNINSDYVAAENTTGPNPWESSGDKSKLEKARSEFKVHCKEVSTTNNNNANPSRDTSLQPLHDLTALLLEQQMKATLPQRTIQPYNGDPLEYCSFMQSFRYGVESKTTNDMDRLYYLEQLTTGEPNRLVKGLLNRGPTEGYQEAKALLARKFGNKYVIADAFKKKAEKWQDIRRDDDKAWTSFSIFLVEYKNTMSDLDCLNEVDHSATIKMLLNKVPYAIRNQWRVLVDNLEQRETKIAGFCEFVEFIEKQTRIVSNPLYGNIVDHAERKNQPSARPHKQRQNSSFATGMQRNDEKGKTSCLHCKNDSHTLEMCKTLQKIPNEERIVILKNLGVCYGCMRTGSHRVKECKSRLSCSICKKRHATVLHCERPPNQSVSVSTTCGLTGAGGLTSVLSVVPVTVHSKESGKVVKTYALLDNKSTAVFCSETLRSKLSMKGTKTRIKIQTINGVKDVNTYKLTGLNVSDVDGNNSIELPDVYMQDCIPVNTADIITKRDLKPWKYLHEIKLPEVLDGQQVELLIGNNVPKALEPIQVIQSKGDGPFASKTALGWEVHGLTKCAFATNMESVHRITVEDVHNQLVAMYDRDYEERQIEDRPQPSREDRLFLNKVEDSVELNNSHYVIKLPFRNEDTAFPNNKTMAENRVAHLKRKFLRNPEFKQDYTSAMNDTLRKGYAEEVPESKTQPDEGKMWYIPHHGVYHPKKNKLRVVFDCAASYRGVSLNKELLQGPDLTNSLVGVISRFRQEPIALMADIEAMFNQVKVTERDRDFLRFLWWPEGNTTKPLKVYRMTTHLFGATSSPSCCNFALRQTAGDNTEYSSGIVTDTINNNFYVDDCLTSVATEKEAISLVKDLSSVLKNGGFRLTKWGSNNRSVLDSVPEEDRAKSMKSLNLQDSLPVERALGVLWSAESDMFGFKIELKDHPLTRRGLLSTVCSVYDPLGFAAPAILPARQILQDLCRLKLGWDDDIPIAQQRKWLEWESNLHKLEELGINRCLKPEGFGNPANIQVHHFADASGIGYGTVSYLRLTNHDGKVHCILLIAKSRVAPIKKVTIPRMELTAATVAVRVNAMLRRELQIPIDDSIFWTDSTTVLRYINNESARYHTFVANRVELIRDGSSPSQWRHVDTAQNPADECSRGQSVKKFVTNQRWIRGPEFLWQEETEWPDQSCTTNSDETQLDNDPEVKASVNAIQVDDYDNPIDRLLRHFSKWHSLKKAVAHLLRLKSMLLQKVKDKASTAIDDNKTQSRPPFERRTSRLSVEDLQNAEEAIVCYVQRQVFAKEIRALEAPLVQNVKVRKSVGKSSPIYRLDPILDNGILKVGGRLGLADIPPEAKHPIIVPKNTVVSELILQYIHQESGHSGRNQILATLHQKFWIISANSSARKIINKCVVCRRQRAKVMEQKMANLPADRVTPDEPPFSKVGMDYFGPIQVKQGRSLVKRYGVVFVCLASKAIHIEKAASLDTDACINVIRRFIARRGQVKEIRSDNGSNLVGAEREMRKEINAWNQTKIHERLLQKNVDWVFNPPAGSHHGGIWERQIRTIRKLMWAVIKEQVLTDDCLLTLLCEIESMVNSRPITRIPGEISDPEPLTPNHLLLLKNNVNLPPAVTGKLVKYATRRWKQVQYLADLFWRRWTREYLPQLQERQKWLQPQRNAQVGDLVLVINESTPRNVWPMGKVIETMPARDGFVRRVRVKTKTSVLVRPIDKLCLLLEADVPDVSRSTSMDTQKESAVDQLQQQADIHKTMLNSDKTRTRAGRRVKPRERLEL